MGSRFCPLSRRDVGRGVPELYHHSLKRSNTMGMKAPTNQGIPTLYGGTRFRSRLEARWAAFFDLVGWRWEYEPFDLPGWIPDFLLVGKCPVLVEVKPIQDTASAHQPIQKCIDSVGRSERSYEVLLLGCTIPISCGSSSDPDKPAMGWLVSPSPSLENWSIRGAFIATHTYGLGPGYKVMGWNGLSRYIDNHESGIYDRITGYDPLKDHLLFVRAYDNKLRSWWSEAGNIVQWSPNR